MILLDYSGEMNEKGGENSKVPFDRAVLFTPSILDHELILL